MWGYIIGICMVVNGEPECQHQQYFSGFTTEKACEVHSIITAHLINYDLVNIDDVHDFWVTPTNCIETDTADFFNKLH